MSTNCPHCGFAIQPKQSRPGEFRPKCPKCGQVFRLVIPANSSDAWIASTLDVDHTTRPEDKPATAYAESSRPVSHYEVTEMVDSVPSAGQAAAKTKADERNDATIATALPEDNKEDSVGDDDSTVPKLLGGYEVVQLLGKGGMGAVYLARQLSLDRPVALKVMNNRWAKDPIFMARFVREAYAAAQLTHHNAVQIYDIGEEKSINFFSMEFVDGKSLGDLVKKQGRVPAIEAAGFVLQAARGLKFAHDRGIIHRDVKPDNLMLNKEGIVKVADLGLVKTPVMTRADDSRLDFSGLKSRSNSKLASVSMEITGAHSAMGSPAYMSPEQCRDAASVDHRADIYSLGCSLYALLTGAPPFGGRTALEVMTKHVAEAPPDITKIAKDVPAELNAIISRMLAKKPEDRYESMQDLIWDLEQFLNPGQTGPYRPSPEQLKNLENLADRFANVPAAKIRSLASLAFFGLFSLLLVSGLMLGKTTLAVVSLFLLVLTPPAYLNLQGLTSKSYLSRKIRQWFFGFRLSDWLTYSAFLGLLAIGLVLMNWLVPFLAAAVLAALWSLGFYFLFDRKLASEQKPIADEAAALLKKWRLAGLEEDRLHNLFAQFGGKNWEQLFEHFFGYEAKLLARQTVPADETAYRKKYARWREPILNRLAGIELERKERKEQKLLQRVEVKRLKAEGKSAAQAKAEAEERALQLVRQVAALRETPAAGNRKPVQLKDVLEEKPVEPGKLRKPLWFRLKESAAFLFSAKLHFLLGVWLIVGTFGWVKQNKSAELQVLRESVKGSVAETKLNATDVKIQTQKTFNMVQSLFSDTAEWKPLNVPGVPAVLTNGFQCFNPLWAGLVLLLSLFFRGRFTKLLFLLSAWCIFAGYMLGLPDFGPLAAHQVSLAIGLGLAVCAILLRQRSQG